MLIIVLWRHGHRTWCLPNVIINVWLHLWIFKNGISFVLNWFGYWELRKLRWYHAFRWAIRVVCIRWTIQHHVGKCVRFYSTSSPRRYRNTKLLPILIINLLLMHETRITHLLRMITRLLLLYFFRVQVILLYLHTIGSLGKVFFFAYRLILDIII